MKEIIVCPFYKPVSAIGITVILFTFNKFVTLFYGNIVTCKSHS